MKTKAAINKALGLTSSKYRNRKTGCLLGHTHDSKAEADHCNSLLADKQASRIFGFQTQVPFEVSPGITHVVDFLIWKFRLSGQFQAGIFWPGDDPQNFRVDEVKGFQTKEWRLKYKLFMSAYPTIEYNIINEEERNKKWLTKLKVPQKKNQKMPISLLKRYSKNA